MGGLEKLQQGVTRYRRGYVQCVTGRHTFSDFFREGGFTATPAHVDMGVGAGPKAFVRVSPDNNVYSAPPVPIKGIGFKPIHEAICEGLRQAIDAAEKDTGKTVSVSRLSVDIPGPEPDPVREPGIFVVTNVGNTRLDVRELGNAVSKTLGFSLERPAIGMNDADAAVLGMSVVPEVTELVRESGATSDYPMRMFGITLGGGIGSAEVLAWVDEHDNVRSWLPQTSMGTAEMGHITVHGAKTTCGCGKTGCIESIASSNGLVALANGIAAAIAAMLSPDLKGFGDIDMPLAACQSLLNNLKKTFGASISEFIRENIPVDVFMSLLQTLTGNTPLFDNGKQVHDALGLVGGFTNGKLRPTPNQDPTEAAKALIAHRVLTMSGRMLGEVMSSQLTAHRAGVLMITGGGADLAETNPLRVALEIELNTFKTGDKPPAVFWLPQTNEVNYAAIGGFSRSDTG